MNPDQLTEEQIFEAAFAQETDEARNEYLQQVCRDDEQIQRIQALLQAGDPDGSFLEKGPADLQAAGDRSPDLPDRIGDFEILGELGRGGMGIVYRARQCSLNRLVALKVLSAGLGLTTKAIMRFKLEAEAAAKLHHTNIVPIYWTGEEKRVPYYAMELIDGPSLDRVIKQLRAESSVEAPGSADSRDQHVPDWIKETLITSSSHTEETTPSADTSTFDSSSSFGTDSSYYDNLARMMADVADALAHAHNHGIVHRDIKPANLLLSADGRLSINDFGLARMLEQPGMTMTGELMGSPMYMSPEQITAGRLPLDHRTDIYSLGATLYELLTLQPPFPGQQRDQVLSQVIHKDPPKPRSINPRIPKDLETICMKAMEKDPDRRYQTAEMLAEDLRRFVNRHAISARRTSPLEKGIRWVRQNKSISAMACLVLLICLGVGVREYRQWKEEVRTEAMNSARNALMNLDADAAGRSLDRLVKLDVPTIEADLIRWQIELMEGRGIPVVEELENKIDQDSDYESDLRIQSLLAAAYSTSGRWDDYVKQVGKLMTLKPKTPEEKFYKARVLIFVDFEESFRLIEEAANGMSAYADFWITHAQISIFRSIARGRPDSINPREADPDEQLEDLDERLHEIETAENNLTNAAKICGEDVYMVLNARFYALLTRTHLLRMKGRCENERNRPVEAERYHQEAEKCLDDAEKYVEKVAKKTNYLGGNFNRFYYYDLRLNHNPNGLSQKKRETYFSEMERVLDESDAEGHVGWLSDPFWSYCLITKQYDHALKKLATLKVDEYAIWRRAIIELCNESSGGKIPPPAVVDKIFDTANKDLPPASNFKGRLLSGKREEVERFYQTRLDSGKVPTGSMQHNVCLYMTGVITAEKFIKLEQDTEYDLVTAYEIIGLKHLNNLNHLTEEERKQAVKEALKYFRLASGGTMYPWTPFITARTYAAKLDLDSPYYDPGWPSWLPAKPIDADEEVKERPD